MYKKQYLFLLFISLTFYKSQSETLDSLQILNNIGYEKLLLKLNKYQIKTIEYNRENIPLLMGNAEIGGLADPQGRGFYEISGNCFWWDSITRKPLSGLMFRFPKYENLTPSKIHQNLSLIDGVLKTTTLFQNGDGYESEMFFSMNETHTLVIKLKNRSNENLYSQIKLPVENFKCLNRTNTTIEAQSDENYFTQINWKLISSLNLNKSYVEDYSVVLPSNIGKRVSKTPYCNDFYSVTIPANDSIIIVYSIYTQYNKSSESITTINYNRLIKENHQSWITIWKNTGIVILPDSKYAEVYYRSLFWLYCTSGSNHFLPSECQFAEISSSMALEYGYYTNRFPFDIGNWSGHSFTYGAPGWAAMAFTALGNVEKSKNILQSFYNPNVLNNNARISFPSVKTEIKTDQDNFGMCNYFHSETTDAWFFGHELAMNGKNLCFNGHRWDWQVHLNAFAASLYQQHGLYYPNDKFNIDTVYPVMKGTAQFWSELLSWDQNKKAYVLPPLLSLSEDLFKRNVIDAVLSAKWNLNEAAKWADRLNRDKELSKIWKEKAARIYIQQNEQNYLEYLDDDGTHMGSGYQGIRGFAYLAYPTVENISLLNTTKINKTLDIAWLRNKKGEGMINFVICWFALADAYMNNASGAYEKSAVCLNHLDPTGTVMMETFTTRPYYLDSYAAFVLVPISMCLQSNNNSITVFPAIPEQFKDIEFYNLPAQSGIRVSAKMTNGKPDWIVYSKDKKTVLRSKSKTVFKLD